MKIKEIFKNHLVDISEQEYRESGLHFSDLQSIYLESPQDVNPETKEENSKRISMLPQVIAGNAFETYMENPMEFETKFKFLQVRPGYTLGELCDKLIEDKVDPQDISAVRKVMDYWGFWKSDKTDDARNKRATLDIASQMYVKQHTAITDEERMSLLAPDTVTSIKESARVLNRDFDHILNDSAVIDQEYQLMLKFEDPILGQVIFIKLDRIRLLEFTDEVSGYQLIIDDFKFKSGNAANWRESYWKYGYWIQALLYKRVVRELSGISTLFYFIVGSNDNPESSVVVSDAVNADMLLTENGYVEGVKIPSIQELSGQLTLHHKVKSYSRPYRVLINGYDIPKSVTKYE